LDVTSGKRATDPLAGVDVSLERVNVKIVAQTKTDNNGMYVFKNVPEGDYRIFVDIPGLGMVETYDISVSQNDTVFESKDFYVDSTGKINIVNPSLGIKKQVEQGLKARVYPNPYLNNTNITFEIKQSGKVQIEVINLLGKQVAVLENKTLSAGKHLYPFSAKALGEAPGVYFVKLKVNEQMQTFRIVEME
jgi:hypothetical protein